MTTAPSSLLSHIPSLHRHGFKHITSSPYYSRSNGEAERAVQTVKDLLKKSGDPYLALLAYRTTPLQCGYSPAQLLMSRNLRSTLPDVSENRVPKVVDSQVFEEKDEQIKDRQKRKAQSQKTTTTRTRRLCVDI